MSFHLHFPPESVQVSAKCASEVSAQVRLFGGAQVSAWPPRLCLACLGAGSCNLNCQIPCIWICCVVVGSTIFFAQSNCVVVETHVWVGTHGDGCFVCWSTELICVFAMCWENIF